MRAPAFWQADGWPVTLLSPFEGITARLTAGRVARQGWTAPVPVICCGNAGVGGAGKTPLCLDILARLRARGVDAHVLTRGHGGTAGTRRIEPGTHPDIAGDEALLLAAVAPCWTGADRAASGAAAIAAGAQALIMDDGLQNPGLQRTASILVIDGAAGFGNGHLLPAGPLREPVAAAAARCAAAVLIGPDVTGALDALPHTMPVLRATLAPGPAMRAFAGKPVAAFAGIGRPEKFFASLRGAGVTVEAAAAFGDHHRFSARELDALRRNAARLNVPLVTTAKDFARIPPPSRGGVVPLEVSLSWDDDAAFEILLRAWVP